MRVRLVAQFTTLVAVALCSADTLWAQTAQESRRWSLEAGIGGSRDLGGDPRAVRENFGVAELGVTSGFRHRSTGSLLAGINYSRYLNNGSNLLCPVQPGVPGCIPDHPEFSAASVLVGWQTPRPERGSLRVLAGPGVYRAGNRDLGNTLGWLARADVASPSLMRISLVASFRTSVVPKVEGIRYRQRVISLGLRIH
jgi:hypothetical protein